MRRDVRARGAVRCLCNCRSCFLCCMPTDLAVMIMVDCAGRRRSAGAAIFQTGRVDMLLSILWPTHAGLSVCIRGQGSAKSLQCFDS